MSTAGLMNGTQLANDILERTAERAADFLARTGAKPCLATVIVGDDPASVTYVKMKENRSHRVGIESRHTGIPASATTLDVVHTITGLSDDPTVHGILLQHPSPPQVDESAAFEAIRPGKDVDGVTMHSFAAMALGRPGFVSCTPGGILRLLDAYEVELSGRHAVVIGRSPILGKPVGMLLLGRDATVTYCHSKTAGPSFDREDGGHRGGGGRPAEVRGGRLADPGAVVIDAGYNPGNVGDVDFDAAAERASLITPVPGGVGPMTIALLMEQTVDAAFQQTALS